MLDTIKVIVAALSFDEEIFAGCFFTVMPPKLHKKEKNLIRDNLSSHLSRSLNDAWSQHKIDFVCLFPNATHLLQLLHVAWFAPLKKFEEKF